LKVRQLPDGQSRELKALLTRRAELVEMLVMEQNRLEHAPVAVQLEINVHINYLRKRLKRVDHDLDRAVERCGATSARCSKACRGWAKC
jgi:transposase